jgi:hypothetical protein
MSQISAAHPVRTRYVNVDRLRLLALADIISFHARGEHLIATGLGLPTFLLFTIALNARPHAGVSSGKFIRRKVAAFLIPWALWSIVYGLVQTIGHIAHHEPPFEWFQPVMFLLGTSTHLWYLIFAAVGSIAAFSIDRGLAHRGTLTVVILMSLLGGGIMIPERLFGAPPPRLDDWLMALPSIPIGVSLGRCLIIEDFMQRAKYTAIAVAISISCMVILEAANSAYSADRYIISLIPAGSAVVWRGKRDRITTFLSRMSFGIYLIHPLMVRFTLGIQDDSTHLVVRMLVVIALSVLGTWLLWISPLQFLVRKGNTPRVGAFGGFTTARTPAPAPHA